MPGFDVSAMLQGHRAAAPLRSQATSPRAGRAARTAWAAALSLVMAAGLLSGCAMGPGAGSRSAPAPAAVAPPLPTPHADATLSYQILDLDWVDAARQRAVPTRIYWPAAAEKGPVGLVVFSHGLGGTRQSYSHLGRYWASMGYASLHVQHSGSDRQLWTGNMFSTLSKLSQAANDGEALARVDDIRFALGELERLPLAPRLDRQRFVVAGHSYGANTSLLLAGAEVRRKGKLISLRDARFAAAILISAPPFYGEEDFSPILNPITIPTLHITTQEDVIRVPGYHSPPDDRVRVFNATGSPFKVFAMFNAGTHGVFNDRRASTPEGLRIKAATQSLSGAFLRQVFERDGGPHLHRWATDHQPMLARFVAP